MLRKIRKNKFKALQGSFIKNLTKTLSIVAIAYTVSLTPAFAQEIIPDNRTNTTLNTSNNVTSIYSDTIRGANAFNSFIKFNVSQGKIVNLMVPDNCSGLINLIHNEATSIDGILNSIKNGHIGGNIFLVNPHGITVGTQGVLNVGSLTAVTPTTDFMNSFFSTAGNISDASIESILNGNTPINNNAVINIKGRINAIEDVRLQTGDFINSGEIYTKAVFEETNVELGDVVNINTLENASTISNEEGNVSIKATNDITNSGIIVTDGDSNTNAGNIDIIAGHNLTLETASLISAKGRGFNSNAGDVYLWGDNDSSFNSGAIIDARGGDISGDAGAIEFSAQNNIFVGGKFKAYAYNGDHGSIYIDPTTVDGSVHFAGDHYSHGADVTVTGNSTIKVDGLISTRVIAGADSKANHLADASTGDSGELTLRAPSIEIDSGSTLLTFADSGFAGKAINLIANSATVDPLTPATWTDGSVSININASTAGDPTIIHSGSDITIYADADRSNIPDIPFLTVLTADATTKIGSNAQLISETGDIIINASTKAEAKGVDHFEENFSIMYSAAEANAVAKINAGASLISQTGKIKINASSDVTTIAIANAQDPSSVGFSAAFADANTVSKAYIKLYDGITLNSSDNIELTATQKDITYARATADQDGNYDKGSSTSKSISDLPNTLQDDYNNSGDSNNMDSTDVSASVAIANSNIDITPTASISVYAGSNINSTSGSLLITTTTDTYYSSVADSSAVGEDNAVGIAVSISNANPGAQSYLASDLNLASGGVSIISEASSNTPDIATVDPTLNLDIVKMGDANAYAHAGAGGALDVAAAIANANSNSYAVSYIKENTQIQSSGDVLISADDYSKAHVIANGNVTDASKVGIGGALSIANANGISQAYTKNGVKLESTDGSINIIANKNKNYLTDSYAHAKAGSGGVKKDGDSNKKALANSDNNTDKASGINIAAAVAIANSNNNNDINSMALINQTNTISAKNDILISSDASSKYSAVADSSAIDAGSVGIGAAVAIAQSQPRANSYIHSDLTSTNGAIFITANSKTENVLPKENTDTIDPNITYANVGDSNAYSKAGSADANFAFEGAVSYAHSKVSAAAYINNGITINSVNDINISAYSQSKAHGISDGEVKLSDNSQSTTVGIGGSVTVVNSLGMSSAYVGNNVTLNSSNGNINILSNKDLDDNEYISSDAYAHAKAGAGGADKDGSSGEKPLADGDNKSNKASSINIAAAVAVANANNSESNIIHSNASIGTGGTITANGDVNIESDGSSKYSSIADGSAIVESNTVGIGAAVAVSNSNSNSQASTDSSITATTGKININATSGSDNVINSSNYGTIDGNFDADSIKVIGGSNAYSKAGAGGNFAFAGSVSTAYSNPSAEAYANNSLTLNSGSDIIIASYDQAKAYTIADGSVTTGGAESTTVGIGGAVAVSNAIGKSRAYIGQDSTITSGGGIYVFSNVDNLDTDYINADAYASATAGAGGAQSKDDGGKSGSTPLADDDNNSKNASGVDIAGAVSVANANNTSDVHSNAFIGSSVNTAQASDDIIIASDASTKYTSIADASKVSSNKVGLGAAVAISNSETQSSSLSFSSLTSTNGSIEISSTSNTASVLTDTNHESIDSSIDYGVVGDSNAYAKAGAAGPIAFEGALAYSNSKPIAKSFVYNTNNLIILNAKKDVTISAIQSAVSHTIADGDVTGAQKVGVGGSVAYSSAVGYGNAYLGQNTQVTAQRDIFILANTTYDAGEATSLLNADSQASAKAGASGGSKKSTEAGEEDTGSGNTAIKNNKGSGVSGVEVAGAVAIANANNDGTTNAEAYISSDKTVSAKGQIYIASSGLSNYKADADASAVLKMSGDAGISGAVSVVQDKSTSKSYIESGTNISADGDITIKASTSADYKDDNNSYTKASSAGADASFAGAVSVANAAPVATSYLGSTVNSGINDDTVTMKNITISAENYSKSYGEADGEASGQAVGFGAGVVVLNSNPVTNAYIKNDASVNNHNRNVIVSAGILDGKDLISDIKGTINIGAGGANSASKAGKEALSGKLTDAKTDVSAAKGMMGDVDIAGGVAIVYTKPITNAYIATGVTITPTNAGANAPTPGYIDITANGETAYEATALGDSLTSGVSVGAAVTVVNALPLTSAYIINNSTIVAGKDDNDQFAVNVEATGNAFDANDNTHATGIGIGGDAGFGGGVAVTNIEPSASAYIGVNEDDPSALPFTNITTDGTVNVSANLDKTQANANANGLAVSGSIGGGAGVVVITNDASASSYINSSTKVDAENISVVSSVKEKNAQNDITGLTGAAGGTAGFSASVVVVNSKPTSKAYVANSADISATDKGSGATTPGTITIISEADTNYKANADTAAIAGTAAIGGSVSYVSAQPNTSAYISNAKVVADNDIGIASTSNATADGKTISVTAAGEGAVGAAVTTSFSNSINTSNIQSGSTVISNNGTVSVSSVNRSTALSIADAAAVGIGTAALAAAIPYSESKPTTSAYISGSTVTSNSTGGNYCIKVNSTNTTHTTNSVLSGSAGFIAVNGTVTAVVEEPLTRAYVEAGSVLTAQNNVEIISSNTLTNSTSANGGGVGVISADVKVLSINSNPESDSYVKDSEIEIGNVAAETGSGDLIITSANTVTGQGETLGIAVGLAAAEVTVPLVKFNSVSNSYIEQSNGNSTIIKLNSGDLSISSNDIVTSTGNRATSASVGLLGLAGSGANIYTKSTSNSYIAGATVDVYNKLSADKGTINIISTGVNSSDGKCTGAGGGVVGAGAAVPDIYATPTAISRISGGIITADKDVIISTSTTGSSSANAVAGAAGGLAGSGAVSKAETTNVSQSYIEKDTTLTLNTGNLSITSVSNATANASSDSTNAGAIAGGAADSTATVKNTSNSYITNEVAKIQATGGNISILSTASESNKNNGATSYASADAGGLASGDSAHGDSNHTARANSYIGYVETATDTVNAGDDETYQVIAGKGVDISSEANSKTTANGKTGAYGFAGGGHARADGASDSVAHSYINSTNVWGSSKLANPDPLKGDLNLTSKTNAVVNTDAYSYADAAIPIDNKATANSNYSNDSQVMIKGCTDQTCVANNDKKTFVQTSDGNINMVTSTDHSGRWSEEVHETYRILFGIPIHHNHNSSGGPNSTGNTSMVSVEKLGHLNAEGSLNINTGNLVLNGTLENNADLHTQYVIYPDAGALSGYQEFDPEDIAEILTDGQGKKYINIIDIAPSDVPGTINIQASSITGDGDIAINNGSPTVAIINGIDYYLNINNIKVIPGGTEGDAVYINGTEYEGGTYGNITIVNNDDPGDSFVLIYSGYKPTANEDWNTVQINLNTALEKTGEISDIVLNKTISNLGGFVEIVSTGDLSFIEVNEADKLRISGKSLLMTVEEKLKLSGGDITILDEMTINPNILNFGLEFIPGDVLVGSLGANNFFQQDAALNLVSDESIVIGNVENIRIGNNTTSEIYYPMGMSIVSNNNNVILVDDVTVKGDIVLQAGQDGFIADNAVVTAVNGNITLESDNNSYFGVSSIITANDINLGCQMAHIDGYSTITANNLTLNAIDKAYIDHHATLNILNNLNLTATNGDAYIASNVQALVNNTINISGTNGEAYIGEGSSITAIDYLNITSNNGDAYLDHPELIKSKNIDLTSSGGNAYITENSTINSDENIRLQSINGDVEIKATVYVTAESDLLLKATSGNVMTANNSQLKSNTGKIEIYGDNISLLENNSDLYIGSKLTAVDVIIHPSAMLHIDGVEINANGSLSITTGNLLIDGLYFNPDSIYTNTLANDNFFQQGSEINLQSDESLYLGNLEQIFIGGSNSNDCLKPTNIALTTGNNAGLGGNVKATGNISLTATNSAFIDNDSVITATGSIALSGDLAAYVDYDSTVTSNASINMTSANGVVGTFMNTYLGADADINIQGSEVILNDLQGLDIVNPDTTYNAGSSIVAAKNLLINPTDMLTVNGVELSAGDTLTLNAGDINTNGVFFVPDMVQAKTLISNNFIGPNISLNSTKSITLGNLDLFSIDQKPIKITDINLSSNETTQLVGDVSTSNSIDLAGNTVSLLSYDSDLFNEKGVMTRNAIISKDISLLPVSKLEIDGIKLIATNSLTINSGDIKNNGIAFAPTSIEAPVLSLDFFNYSTPLVINSVNGDVKIGNLDLVTIAGKPIEITGLDLGSNDTLEISGSNSISGDVNLNAPTIVINGDNTSIVANNVSINPAEMLNLYGASLISNNNMTLNAGDIINNGVVFSPELVETKNFASDFITPSNDLLLTSNKAITIGNLNNVIINGDTLKLKDIKLTANNNSVELNGEVSTTSDIELIGSNVIITGNGSTIAASNMTLTPSEKLVINGSNILVHHVNTVTQENDGVLTINSGNIQNFGITFDPDSIKADTIAGDLLTQDADFVINSDKSVEIGDLAYVEIGNKPLNLQDVLITSQDQITIDGKTAVYNDITLNAHTINITEGSGLYGTNLTINPDVHLNISGGEFLASDTLTINAGFYDHSGMTFTPESVTANEIDSEFLQDNSDIDLSSRKSITIGNLTDITLLNRTETTDSEGKTIFVLNPQRIKINNITLESQLDITLSGDVIANGDIKLDAVNVSLNGTTSNVSSSDGSNVVAVPSSITGNNIYIIPTGMLEIDGGNLVTQGDLNIASGNISRNGLVFAPNHIKAQSINCDFFNNYDSSSMSYDIDLQTSGSFKLGNLQDILIDGKSLFFNSLDINAGGAIDLQGNIAVVYNSNDVTQGDLNVNAYNIFVNALNTNITAKNILFNPGNFLSVSGGIFIADNEIDIRGGDLLKNGIIFVPDNINAQSLGSDSFFDVADGSDPALVLESYGTVELSNLSNIDIKGELYKPESITIHTDDAVILGGNTKVAGNIILNGIDRVQISSDSSIISETGTITLSGMKVSILEDKTDSTDSTSNVLLSASNIVLDPYNRLEIYGSEINAANQLNVNTGKYTNNGLLFAPDSISAGTLIADSQFINNNVINLTSTSSIVLGNLDNITVGGTPFDFKGLIVSSDRNVELIGANQINGNISLQGLTVTLKNDFNTTVDNLYSALSEPISIVKGQNVSLNPVNSLAILASSIEADNLTLNSGDITNDGLTYSPGYVTVSNTFISDFLTPGDQLSLSSNKSIILGNLDNITINSVTQQFYGLEISAGEIAQLTGKNTIIESANIANSGNIEFKGNIVMVDQGSQITAENISLEPDYYLDVKGGTIIANQSLFIGGGDYRNNGITFTPEEIEAKSLNSNFFAQNGNLDLQSSEDINIGNMNKITINNQSLIQNAISIVSLQNAVLSGDMRGFNIGYDSLDETYSYTLSNKATGEVNIHGNEITIEDGAALEAYKIYLNPTFYMNVGSAAITANTVNINSGNHADGGITFNPDSITAVHFDFNLIEEDANNKFSFDLSTNASAKIGGLDNIYIDGTDFSPVVNGDETTVKYSFAKDQLELSNININAEGSVTLAGSITTHMDATNNGDIVVSAEQFFLEKDAKIASDNDLLIKTNYCNLDTTSTNTRFGAVNEIIISRKTSGDIDLGLNGNYKISDFFNISDSVLTLGNSSKTNSYTYNFIFLDTLNAKDSSVTISAFSNVEDLIVEGGNDVDILAKNLDIISDTGRIGNINNNIYIDLNASTLNAQANKDIRITEVAGDDYIGQIKSTTGDIYLYNENGSFIRLLGSTENIVSANALIETKQDIDLDFNVSTFTELTAGGDINISGATGELYVSAGRNFTSNNLIANKTAIEAAGNGSINTTTINGLLLAGIEGNLSVENLEAQNTLFDVLGNTNLLDTQFNGILLSLTDGDMSSENLEADAFWFSVIGNTDLLETQVTNELLSITEGNFVSQNLYANEASIEVTGSANMARTHINEDLELLVSGNLTSRNIKANNATINIIGDANLLETSLNDDLYVTVGGNLTSETILDTNAIIDVTGNANMIATRNYDDIQLTVGGTLDSEILRANTATIEVSGNTTLLNTGINSNLELTVLSDLQSTDLTAGDTRMQANGNADLLNTQIHGNADLLCGSTFTSENFVANNTELYTIDNATLLNTTANGFFIAEIGEDFTSETLVADNTELNVIGNIDIFDTTINGNLDIYAHENFVSTILESDNTLIEVTGDSFMVNTTINGRFTNLVDGNFASLGFVATFAEIEVGGNTDLLLTQIDNDLTLEVWGDLTSDTLIAGSALLETLGNSDLLNTTITNGLEASFRTNLNSENLEAENAIIAVVNNADLLNTHVHKDLHTTVGGNLTSQELIAGDSLLDVTGDTSLLNTHITGNLTANLSTDANIRNTIVEGTVDFTVGRNLDLIDLDAKDTTILVHRNETLDDIQINGSLKSTTGGTLRVENLYATQDINLTIQHDINADRINSDSGSIFIDSIVGNAFINYISAPNTVSVIVGGSIIQINTLDPTKVILISQAPASSIGVVNGMASEKVAVDGDTINMNFTGTGTSNPLVFDISGVGGGLASDLRLNINSATGSKFTNLEAQNAIINNNYLNTLLDIHNATVTNSATLYSDYITAIDNICFSTLSLFGATSTATRAATVVNHPELIVKSMIADYANVGTNSGYLNVKNAIVNDMAYFNNDTIKVGVDDEITGSYMDGVDVLLRQGSGVPFYLILDSSRKSITTNTDLVALSHKALFDLTIINNGMVGNNSNSSSVPSILGHTEAVAELYRDYLLNNLNAEDVVDFIQNNDLISMLDPDLYLDETFETYTVMILLRAVDIYQTALANNLDEEEALMLASDFLKSVKFNPYIAKELLKKDMLNENRNFAKILEFLSVETPISNK